MKVALLVACALAAAAAGNAEALADVEIGMQAMSHLPALGVANAKLAQGDSQGALAAYLQVARLNRMASWSGLGLAQHGKGQTENAVGNLEQRARERRASTAPRSRPPWCRCPPLPAAVLACITPVWLSLRLLEPAQALGSADFERSPCTCNLRLGGVFALSPSEIICVVRDGVTKRRS